MSTKQKSPLGGKRVHTLDRQSPTFVLELPLVVDAGQAKRLRGHLEAGRQLYNALLSEGQHRLRRMRADPDWQAARAISPSRPQERAAAFRALRTQHGFSEFALHEAAKGLRVSWLAEHIDAVLAQTLATRAYRALNRVCLGRARRVRTQRAGGEDSEASRTNATTPPCALCFSHPRRAIMAGSSGKMTV